MQHATRTRWFDSTRFAPNQLLKVKMVATGNDGSTDTKYAECMVKNRVGGYDYSKFLGIPGGNGGLIWKERMINAPFKMIYDTYQQSPGWGSTAIWERLDAGTSVVYMNSHGFSASSPRVIPGLMFNMHQTDLATPQAMFAGLWDKDAPSSSWTQGRDCYEGFMMQVIASFPLPPFNPNGKPPISLLWLDCCLCGSNDAFEKALWPYFSVYFPDNIKNKAVVAFKPILLTRYTESAAKVATACFALDMTLDETAKQLVRRRNIWVEDASTGKERLLAADDFNIMGDRYTRMNGVYTGSNEKAVKGWYY